MEFKITKDQIEKLAITGNADTERYLQSIFPEAFERELDLNKWYTRENCANTIMFITHKIDGNFYGGYGISNGAWKGKYIANNDSFRCIPATREEVEAALIAEAKKRGYKIGVSTKSGKIINGYKEWSLEDDWFYHHNIAIFDSGKWAEILPTEKTVITREKALKNPR